MGQTVQNCGEAEPNVYVTFVLLCLTDSSIIAAARPRVLGFDDRRHLLEVISAQRGHTTSGVGSTRNCAAHSEKIDLLIIVDIGIE